MKRRPGAVSPAGIGGHVAQRAERHCSDRFRRDGGVEIDEGVAGLYDVRPNRASAAVSAASRSGGKGPPPTEWTVTPEARSLDSYVSPRVNE